MQAVVVDVPLRPAVEQFVECDAALQPGQVGAQATVHALAEGEVGDVVAPDVERIGVVVAPGVAVGGSEQHQDGATGGDRSVVTVVVAQREAPDMGSRRLEAQRLVDGAGEQ